MPISSRLGALRAPKRNPQISDPFHTGRPALLSKQPDAGLANISAGGPSPASDPMAPVDSDKNNTWHPSDGFVFASVAANTPTVDRRIAKRGSRSAHASGVVAATSSITNTKPGKRQSSSSHGDTPQGVDRLRSTYASADDEQPLESQFTSLSLAPAPSTGLSYFMTRETHLEAKHNNRYWHYGFYKNSRGEKPTLHYCRKRASSEHVARLFLNDKVIGFDIEWSPRTFYRSAKARESADSIKENVSVIQIASESRIAVFQLALHAGTTAEDLLAPSLRRIMESHHVAKVGVCINADCTRIDKYLGTYVNSRVELSHVHNLVSHFKTDPSKINRKAVALHTLVQEHLGLPLCKDEVRTSHWDRELDITQLHYAGSDAYASLQLYHVLNAKRLALDPAPPMPEYAELKRPIRLVDHNDTESDAAEVTPAGSLAHTAAARGVSDPDYKP